MASKERRILEHLASHNTWLVVCLWFGVPAKVCGIYGILKKKQTFTLNLDT